MPKTLVIAPPPTPNGDLHVGHMAGPYLAADIYARSLRSQNKSVNYGTGTDDSQTYVVTSALKLNITPEQLGGLKFQVQQSVDRMQIIRGQQLQVIR